MKFQKFKIFGENHYIFDAKMLIENVNDILGISIDEEDIDTIGGWFMTQRFEAIQGEKIIEQGYEFMVKDWMAIIFFTWKSLNMKRKKPTILRNCRWNPN